ncbi:MAG: hypothetical protein Q9O62_07285, partial [Ardenticatenia bacterium]|nr:hypothetical protein [Ardenticatenia bacterium]
GKGGTMRTVEWSEGVVKMIDQRLLPHRFEVAEFHRLPGRGPCHQRRCTSEGAGHWGSAPGLGW